MIRVGVLGCGRIGRTHARNIARRQRRRLTTVFDVVPAAPADLDDVLGFTATGSAEAAIADPTIHAVLIATRPTRTSRCSRPAYGPQQGGPVREADRPQHRADRRVLDRHRAV